MKKLWIIACISLVAFAAMTPQAHAGGRIVFSVGIGYGGGYYPYGGGYYPYGGRCSYPHAYPAAGYGYGYGYAVPYAWPFVTYGYVSPLRFYPGPRIVGYTLSLPRYRVQPAPRRDDRGRSPVAYGNYAPRVYGRRR